MDAPAFCTETRPGAAVLCTAQIHEPRFLWQTFGLYRKASLKGIDAFRAFQKEVKNGFGPVNARKRRLPFAGRVDRHLSFNIWASEAGAGRMDRFHVWGDAGMSRVADELAWVGLGGKIVVPAASEIELADTSVLTGADPRLDAWSSSGRHRCSVVHTATEDDAQTGAPQKSLTHDLLAWLT